MLEVVFPNGYGAGIPLPVLFKLVESPLGFFYVYRTINAFQLLCESTPLLTGNITNRVSYEMDNTALYGDVREDSLCALFLARYAVNRENARILDATGFELIEKHGAD